MVTPIVTMNPMGTWSTAIGDRYFTFEDKVPSTTCPRCCKDGKYIKGHMVPCSVSDCRRSIHAYHGAEAEYTPAGDFVICTGCLPKIKQ